MKTFLLIHEMNQILMKIYLLNVVSFENMKLQHNKKYVVIRVHNRKRGTEYETETRRCRQ